MQKKDKNHIRFDRRWNPKRIAMIFMVQILRDYLKYPEEIEKIDSDNYMYELLQLNDGKQKDALSWFADEWSEEVFSFNWVCEILEIIPLSIRNKILDGEVSFEDIEHTQVAFID